MFNAFGGGCLLLVAMDTSCPCLVASQLPQLQLPNSSVFVGFNIISRITLGIFPLFSLFLVIISSCSFVLHCKCIYPFGYHQYSSIKPHLIFNFLLFLCLAGMQEDFINSVEKVLTVILYLICLPICSNI